MQPLTSESYNEVIQPDGKTGRVTRLKRKEITFLVTGIKILGGTALLFWAVKDIRWEVLSSIFGKIDPTWFILVVIAILFTLFAKLWRWGRLVRNYHIKVSSRRLFSSYFLGQAANIVLPLRGGDVIRIGHLTGEAGILPQVTTTVVLEKYMDLLAILFCILSLSVNLAVSNIFNLRALFLSLTFVIIAVFVVVVFFGEKVWVIIRSRTRLPANVIQWIDKWVNASQWLKSPKKILPSVILTGVIWMVMWLTNLMLFQSLGMPQGITAAGLVLVSVYIGLIPALMPGNIGPFYFFTVLPLLPLGVSHEQALVFAVVKHILVSVPPLICGAIGLFLRSERATAE